MKSGINLGMSLYKTLALGNNVGILEVVRNAETLGDIHRGGACLAFCDKTLYQ